MKDWNVVVTAKTDAWKQARRFIARFGTVARSDFYNVMLLRVDDMDWFLTHFATAVGDAGIAAHGIAHVFPARTTFSFATREEFESKAREAAVAIAPQLAGKRFYTRMHRRGFKGRISSHDEERMLDSAILDALVATGKPGEIAFDEPDAVIDIESVGNQAGLSLWTNEDLERYPFLRID